MLPTDYGYGPTSTKKSFSPRVISRKRFIVIFNESKFFKKFLKKVRQIVGGLKIISETISSPLHILIKYSNPILSPNYRYSFNLDKSRELEIDIYWRDWRSLCAVKFLRLDEFVDDHRHGMALELEPQGLLFAEVPDNNVNWLASFSCLAPNETAQ